MTINPGETWHRNDSGWYVTIVSVYPDAVTYRQDGRDDALRARTIDDFLGDFHIDSEDG
jgi:hypothetical protein